MAGRVSSNKTVLYSPYYSGRPEQQTADGIPYNTAIPNYNFQQPSSSNPAGNPPTYYYSPPGYYDPAEAAAPAAGNGNQRRRECCRGYCSKEWIYIYIAFALTIIIVGGALIYTFAFSQPGSGYYRRCVECAYGESPCYNRPPCHCRRCKRYE